MKNDIYTMFSKNLKWYQKIYLYFTTMKDRKRYCIIEEAYEKHKEESRNPMIDIKGIAHGWLTLTINDKSFHVSYLSDFINDIRGLLDFTDNKCDMKVNRTYLDGEGIDLYLTTWQYSDELVLVWELYDEDCNPCREIMTFNYEDFVNEFNHKFEEVKDDYYKKFDLEESIKREDWG